MNQHISENAKSTSAPKVGFVSLGCAKALTDSELILTQLSAEGYQTVKTFAGADLVIVNTCGFIDDAVKESLDTIGEALAENGKVIVTGCLGAKAGEGGSNLIRQMHPSVLAVTGPQATQEVMDAVHANLPKPHDPFVDLIPNAFGSAGIKLTPGTTRTSKSAKAATIAARFASFRRCVVIWFPVRLEMCSKKRKPCLKAVSKSCW